jgi:alpha-ribazole phosphatase
LNQVVTTIDLIRHGEPVGGSKYRGQIDDPLSDKGWQQMRVAVGEHCPWQSVVSSPLSRCADFAAELAQHNGLPLSLDERFREIGFGAWEGCTKDEITAAAPQALKDFYADPVVHRPPGAEYLTGFEHRVVGAWRQLLQKYTGHQVLLVAHAGVIRVLVCHVLGAPVGHMFRIQVPNAAITRIRVDGEGEAAAASLLFHAGRL